MEKPCETFCNLSWRCKCIFEEKRRTIFVVATTVYGIILYTDTTTYPQSQHTHEDVHEYCTKFPPREFLRNLNENFNILCSVFT